MNEHSQTFTAVRESIAHLEQRLELRFNGFEQRVDRQFAWLVGLQVTTLLAIITALAAIVGTLLSRA